VAETVNVALYAPLIRVTYTLECAVQGRWETCETVQAIDTANIMDLVGIWDPPDSDNVYVLRKHPSVGLLNLEEMEVLGHEDEQKELEGDENL
jgi:hypothetical protein